VTSPRLGPERAWYGDRNGVDARQEQEEAGRVGPLLSGSGDVHDRASGGVIGVEMGTKGNIGLESSFFYHTSF
jgi:hypothetical protein